MDKIFGYKITRKGSDCLLELWKSQERTIILLVPAKNTKASLLLTNEIERLFRLRSLNDW